MNEPNHLSPPQIQTHITLAETHLTQQTQILNQLAELDGRLATLNQQTPAIESRAVYAKRDLDHLKGRVLPVLGGWLSGAGTPEQQETAAKKFWQAAEETLTRHLHTITQLEAEQEALEADLLPLATADEEVAAAHHARDQWLIAHSGTDGRHLAMLITKITSLQTTDPHYQAAIEQSEHLLIPLQKGIDILQEIRPHAPNLPLKEIFDPPVIIRSGGNLSINRMDKEHEFITTSQQISQQIDQLQDTLITIGQRLWPDPKISWHNIPTVEHAHLRLQTTKTKITQKLTLLQATHQMQASQLTQLSQERHTLTQRLWTAALDRP